VCGVPPWGDIQGYRQAAVRAVRVYNFSQVPLDSQGYPTLPFLYSAAPSELLVSWRQLFVAGVVCFVIHIAGTLLLCICTQRDDNDDDFDDDISTPTDSGEYEMVGTKEQSPLVVPPFAADKREVWQPPFGGGTRPFAASGMYHPWEQHASHHQRHASPIE